MVEELLAERSIIVSYETIRQSAGSSARISPTSGVGARAGDKWHLDEVRCRP